ncbi:MAG: YDG domain-containing protein [Bdellovibrionales bacterium]
MIIGVCKQDSRKRGRTRTLAYGCLFFALCPWISAVPSFADTPAATQLPTGGNVTSGSANIVTSGAVMDVNQSTQKAIINWNTFDVGSQAQVNFNQPNASSQTLNRVMAGDASQIYGKINANGQVFLINPNGVVFGAGSQVNAAGMVASTMDISDENFQAGTYKFERNGATGSVVNEGTLQVMPGGSVVLLGAKVVNKGTINAPQGKAVLVAGDKVEVPLTDSGLITIEAIVGGEDAEVTNSGTITAEQVHVATSGTLKTSGTIQATDDTGTGGKIDILGNNVILTETSITDASGATGGGTINIGGAFQGGGDTQRAKTTTVESGALIEANATDNGNGGEIVVWSDEQTSYSGSISAKGGAQGGDGGNAEVSGKKYLNFLGTVDLTAANGATGTLLLDPYNVTISSSASVTDTCAAGTCTPTGNDSILNVTVLTTVLASSSVNVTTGSSGSQTGNITIASPLALGALNNNLTLTAAGNIYVNNTVSWSKNRVTLTASAGDVNINAVMTASGTAVLTMTPSTGNVNMGFAAGGGFAGRVDYTSSGTLTINGSAYTVINSLGAVGSTTGTDLQGMQGNLSRYYALGSDIDASGTSSWNSGAGFAPIGTTSTPFTGVFNGLGHTVSGLYINRSSTYYVGLFGAITAAATVRNVGVVSSSVSGSRYTGLVVGGNYGTVTNNYSTGSVASSNYSAGGLVGYVFSGGTISNSYSSANVTGTGAYHYGGLVGTLVGTVSNSYATGSVNGPWVVGGFVGQVQAGGLVTNCYSTGSVTGTAADSSAGGFVGSSIGTISNSYSTGAVTGNTNTGGFIGFSNGGITNSYWNTTTSGMASASGNGSNAGMTGLTTTQMKTYSSFSTAWSGIISSGGSTTATWVMYDGYSYPLLRSLLQPLTVTANDASKTYNAVGYSGGNGLTYSVTPNMSYLSGTVSYSGTSQGATNVGSYVITPSGGLYSTSNFGYNILSYSSGTLTISAAPITVTANTRSKTYGSTLTMGTTEFTRTGTMYGSDAVSGVTLTSTGAVSTANAGSYTITPSAATGTGLSNYSITYTTGTLTVNTAPLTIRANNRSKTYGSTLTMGTTEYTITSGTLYNGNTVTGATLTSSGAASSATVGTYTITPSAATGTGLSNYAITYTNATTGLTVNTAPLTIRADNRSKTYGDTLALGTTAFTITSGTLYNGNTVTGVTLTSAGAEATATVIAGGAYAITPSDAVGTGLSNYAITYADATLGLTVNPKTLTISGVTANNKIYDGTTAATLDTTSQQLVGIVNGDTVDLTAGTGVFASKDVGTGITVTASGFAISGAGAGNYDITQPAGLTANITAASLTLEITADNQSKTYGTIANLGTTAFTLTDGSLYGGDTLTGVTLTSTGSGATATVGTYAIVPSDATGSGIGNYTISYINGTLTVNPAALTVTASNQSKTYGAVANLGTTSFTTSGLLNSDTVTGATLTSAGAAATATVAGGPYAITVSDATGTGLSNYTITYANAETGLTVNAAALTITANDRSKTYGSTLSLGTTEFATSGLLNSDTVTGATLASAGAAATATVAGGPYTISASDATGTGLSNYSITYNTGALTVNTAALTITASNQSKTYGTLFDLGTTAFTASGLLNSDTVTGATLTSAGSAATATVAGGPYAIVASNATGTGISNYTITYVDAPVGLTVNKASLAGVIAANNKVYDGTTSATLDSLTLSGTIYGTDAGNLTITSTGSTFNTKDVATANLVTAAGLSLSGSAAGNYELSATTATDAANITPASLTGAITVNNKVYDGTTTATLASLTLSGTIYGADAANLILTNATADFNTKDVLTANLVTATGLSLSGSAASNYQLSAATATDAASITPKALTVSGITADDKVYDGTTTVTLNLGGAALAGVIAADAGNVTFSDIGAAYAFADKNAGTAKAITTSGFSISGSAISNYALTQPTGLTATITKAILTIAGAITANNKTFDGKTTAILNTAGAVLSGIIGADDVSPSGGSGVFANASVGKDKAVTVTGFMFGGADAGNYQIVAMPTGLTADIDAVVLHQEWRTSSVAAALNNAGFGGMEAIKLPNNSFMGVDISKILKKNLLNAFLNKEESVVTYREISPMAGAQCSSAVNGACRTPQ